VAFEVIETSKSLICVKIKSELKNSELGQMQTAVVETIKRVGKIRILVILEDFQG